MVHARAYLPIQIGHVEQWSARALSHHITSDEAREAEQAKAVPPRDRMPWLSKGHVALALSGGCVCPSSGSCSLWVVRVVTLIPMGP